MFYSDTIFLDSAFIAALLIFTRLAWYSMEFAHTLKGWRFVLAVFVVAAGFQALIAGQLYHYKSRVDAQNRIENLQLELDRLERQERNLQRQGFKPLA